VRHDPDRVDELDDEIFLGDEAQVFLNNAYIRHPREGRYTTARIRRKPRKLRSVCRHAIVN